MTESYKHPCEAGKVAEGDLSSNEQGSCARKNGGKVSFSLLPLHLLAGVCRVLRFGLKKYAAWNWAKGSDWSQSFDCTLRHLLRWWYMCEENDKESGLHHIDHAICNLLFIRHNILTYPAGDDRPPVDVTRFNMLMEFFDTLWTYEDDVPDPETEASPCDEEYTEGKAVCYNFDFGTATAEDGRRGSRVEPPKEVDNCDFFDDRASAERGYNLRPKVVIDEEGVVIPWGKGHPDWNKFGTNGKPLSPTSKEYEDAEDAWSEASRELEAAKIRMDEASARSSKALTALVNSPDYADGRSKEDKEWDAMDANKGPVVGQSGPTTYYGLDFWLQKEMEKIGATMMPRKFGKASPTRKVTCYTCRNNRPDHCMLPWRNQESIVTCIFHTRIA